ncbi:hypothetical protein [Carnobacterium maltaromaticum]|uniref:hypothetical protein n=1 Tax=Carnobacterium maltaromaticum TaxID=2751 RepID=UPI00295F18C0|nr:hypothetical protein [Carnobacterium maltaromaticum]
MYINRLFMTIMCIILLGGIFFNYSQYQENVLLAIEINSIEKKYDTTKSEKNELVKTIARLENFENTDEGNDAITKDFDNLESNELKDTKNKIFFDEELILLNSKVVSAAYNFDSSEERNKNLSGFFSDNYRKALENSVEKSGVSELENTKLVSKLIDFEAYTTIDQNDIIKFINDVEVSYHSESSDFEQHTMMIISYDKKSSEIIAIQYIPFIE